MRRKKITGEEVKYIKKESWKILVGGLFLNIIVGSFYAFGSYSIYIASFLKANNPEIKSDTIAFFFPLMNILMNALIPFGEKFVNSIGNRWAIF